VPVVLLLAYLSSACGIKRASEVSMGGTATRRSSARVEKDVKGWLSYGKKRGGWCALLIISVRAG